MYLFIWGVTKNSFAFILGVRKKNNGRYQGSASNQVAALKRADGMIHRLEEDALLIGRSPSCQIRVLDEFTSQHHATLRKEKPGWLLEDEESTNGTFVNGKKITRKTYLKYGDTIVFGRTGFKFERG